MTRSRLVADVAIAIAVGVLLAILANRFPSGLVPGDAFTYLAAGERLNAGHPLYAISPGDRPLGVEPPYWTVPLLSPPSIAVLWRPLAALPAELGVGVWWALHVCAVTAAFVLVARRRPLLAATSLLILAFPFAYELSVANLNGFVLLGLVLAWRATALGQERASGVAIGALAALKLTPALLGWWLLTMRRAQSVRWALATGLAILVLSVAGAGLEAHLTYLGIVGQTAAGGARPLSLGGIGELLGLPAGVAHLLPTLALLAGVAGIWLLRRHPDRGFQLAVAALVLGSPTVSISWYALLFAMLAPLAWPLPERVGQPGQPGDRAPDLGASQPMAASS